MLETLVLFIALVLAALVVRWLHKSGIERNQVRRVIGAYALTLLAMLVSFHVVNTEIVPKTALSVILVFVACAYFGVYGYMILKTKEA